MYFNSYIFMLAFLPVTLIGYFLINRTKKYQLGQIWLIFASMIFIGYLNIGYMAVTAMSVLLGYAFIIAVTSLSKYRKLLCMAGVFVHVAVLLYYKYTNFFLENMNQLLGSSITDVVANWYIFLYISANCLFDRLLQRTTEKVQFLRILPVYCVFS